MIDFNHPESVREKMVEGVSGLKARPDMRAQLIQKTEPRRQRKWSLWMVPVAAAALIILTLGMGIGLRSTVPVGDGLYNIQAGDGPSVTAKPVDLASVQMELEGEEEDHAVLLINSNLYTMTGFVPDGKALAETEVSTVSLYTETPYEHDNGCISNAVLAGTAVYTASGIPWTTAVLAEVDGNWALFQRTAEHGFGLNGDSFEATCAVRGMIAQMTLEGAGTLSGEKAEEAMACLYDSVRLVSAEALTGEQMLIIELKNGLQIYLSVSGEQIIGCGAWDGSQFLELFQTLL